MNVNISFGDPMSDASPTRPAGAPRSPPLGDVFTSIAALSVEARLRLGRAVAARASQLGLRYLSKDGARGIAVALPRTSTSTAELLRRRRLAQTALGALTRVAGTVLGNRQALGTALLAELSPLERSLLGARAPGRIATARADLVVDVAGQLRLLELNATIPAMQGYSDIAVRAFVEVWLEWFRPDAPKETTARLLAGRSNASRLLSSLEACYREDGGVAVTPSIALVHRAGDSQFEELTFLAERFREAGHDARTVVVDDIALAADGSGVVDGFAADIFYRHIFARRLLPGSPFATLLANATRHHVYNPVAAPLEQKGMLAHLSEVAADDAAALAVGLSDDEVVAVRAHVPWTRRLVAGHATLDPAGAVVDLTAFTAAHRHDLVLKRSWDFGGHSVVLGCDDAAVAQHSERHFNKDLDWQDLVAACTDEGGWVVQERVRFAADNLIVADGASASAKDVFVDASAYTAVGDDVGDGCVSRASVSPVVNIQSGGGVVPIIAEDLAAQLAAVPLSGFAR